MTTATESHATGYIRRLYDDVLGWYHNADTKAQVILAIDGTFLAFLSGALFAAPGDLAVMVGAFGWATWVLLGLMAAALAGSLACAIYCLWSRIYSRDELRDIIHETPEGRGQGYGPDVSWFFQMISVLEPDRLRRTLASADAAFELEAMTMQVHRLAANVRRKHQAVNLGFVLAAATLWLFFAAGVSYLVAVVG